MNRTETLTMHVGHFVKVEVTPAVERAIETARSFRATGSSKVAAVRAMYPEIANEPREAIWYAIIHGVNLSSRGAVTYYYIMRRERTKRSGQFPFAK